MITSIRTNPLRTTEKRVIKSRNMEFAKFRNKSIDSKSNSGPLRSKFPSKHQINNTTSKSMESFFSDELKLTNWEQKLKNGYLPSQKELLDIQQLVYTNLQKVELASKIIQSIQQTLTNLKQTRL